MNQTQGSRAVTNDVTAEDMSGSVIQAKKVHIEGLHVTNYHAVPDTPPSARLVHASPAPRWLVPGLLLAVVTVATTTFLPLHDTHSGQSRPQTPTDRPLAEISTFDLRGTLTTVQPPDRRHDNPLIDSTANGCEVTGNYSDLFADTAVTVAVPQG